MRDDIIRTRGREVIANENRQELQAWIDERVDDLVVGGMNPDDARRRALDEFGDLNAAARYGNAQDVAADRRIRVQLWLEEFASDQRIAARTLARTPAVTAVVLLTLAIGVGATTAVFSVTHAMLLRPLPYGAEESLAYLAAMDDGVIRPGLGGGRHSGVALMALRERTSSFSGIAAAAMGNGILRGEGDPEQLWMASLTPNAFDVFQARAAIGRTFVDTDVGGRPVVVLTDGLWRRRFGASPSVVGRTIDYGGAVREIVGVMPPGFRVPTYEQAELFALQELTNILRGETSKDVRAFRLFGRVKPGESFESAQADLIRVMRGLQAEAPRAFNRIDTRAVPIRAAMAGDARPRLLVLFGAAVFVLLIACANIAGVLLSCGIARQSELALRAALGAGRARLVRQFTAEGAVLAFFGGAFGLIAAQLGIAFLRQIALTALPPGTTFALEPPVVTFGILAAVATAFVATMIPAFAATRGLAGALRRDSGRTTPSRASRRMRLTLVGAQLAVAVVLLVGAGLLLRTMQRLAILDLGYASDHAVTFRAQFTGPKSSVKQDAFYAELYAQLRAIPGVVSAGGGNLPAGGQSSVTGLAIEGRAEGGRLPDVRYTPVSDDYFATLRIPVIRGRAFTSEDRNGAPWVAVVSAGLARQFWPGADPIGARVRVGPDRPWATIVGIVGDVRMGAADAPQPSVYTSQRQDHWPGGAPIVMRTSGDPALSIAAVRDVVRRVDPSVVVPSVTTVDEVRRGTPAIAERHVQMRLMVVFSIIALAVSTIGVYGVSAYAAHARAMEFAIRIVLGASRVNVMWLAIRDSAVVAALGAAAGISLGWLVAHRLREMLFAVQPYDLATMVAAVGVLTIVVFVASIVPARRAARVDPITAIRAE